MNTKLREQIKEILKDWYGLSYPYDDKPMEDWNNKHIDQIISLFPDTTKMSQSYQEDPISYHCPQCKHASTVSLPNDYLREYGRTVHKGGVNK